MLRALLPALMAALVVALLLVTNRTPDAAPPEASKPGPVSTDLSPPAGLPVQLDGRVVPAEWADATQRPIGNEGAVLRIKQSRGTLLLAFTATSAWPSGAHLWFVFRPDDGNGLYDAGSLRVDLEPLEHNRPHLLVLRMGTHVEEIVDGVAVARAEVHGTSCSAEFAIDLGALGIDDDGAGPLRFACLWMRGGHGGTASWPFGLKTEAPAGSPPADLVTSTGWGLLQGWVEADGPGAYSGTEWKGMIDADRELAQRGRDAHAVALEIAEEPHLRKEDRTQVPALIDNLAWIAQHEPLTPYDLLALAEGLRFLNRTDEALAVFDALASHASWRDAERLLYERARTLEAAERYEEAARAWERLAREIPTRMTERYEGTAQRARERLEEHAREQRHRDEDRARADLPLVLLRTVHGDVLLQLFRDDVPQAVAHFLDLVRRPHEGKGFYDGTFFHRVIGGFVAQGGDPLGRDEGCEFAGSGDGPSTIPLEINERHGFWRGAVAFARGPAPRNGCQFFILVGPRPQLGSQEYTCFGHVLSGMDVVDRIETCDEILEMRVIGDGDPDGTEPEDR